MELYALLLVGAAILLAFVAFLQTRSRRARQIQFAWLWARMSPQADLEIRERKRELFDGLRGDVVEIGPGVGANLAYFSCERVSRLTLAEPNEFMHRDLRAAALRARFRPEQVSIMAASAVQLPLADASVDAVVCTLVLCSAEDPLGVVREALRVLRPGGRFLFLEHVAAPEGVQPGRALLQRCVMATGLWSALGDGCELTRDTGAILRTATAAEEGAALTLSECDVRGCSAMAVLAGSQVQGCITKAAR